MSKMQNYQTGKSAEVDVDERRRQERYPFTVTVEAVELKSKTRIQGRTSDLSREGCYVDSITSFPAGSIVELRLMKEKRSFEAQGEVVYSLSGMGMGVKFKSADPETLWIVNNWIRELSGEFLSQSEIPQVPDESCAQEAPNNDENLVLNELLLALMQHGVLPDTKCRTLLHKLDRSRLARSNSGPTRI
jgi:hypothetical protein